MSNIVWSYSSLSTFKQCPKKYHHLKVLKDVKDTGSEATIYGQSVHTAAEEFIRDGTPIPAKFNFMVPFLESLAAKPGTKHCEMKLGVKKNGGTYEPCGFFDGGVWWRGIADLVIINGNKAFSIDYKTSKSARYADTKQLDAVAAAVFTHFPEVETIKSALAFVVSDELVKKVHYREHRDKYFESFQPDLDRLEGAMENGVWNANAGPLCGYCPVKSCSNWRPPKTYYRHAS